MESFFCSQNKFIKFKQTITRKCVSSFNFFIGKEAITHSRGEDNQILEWNVAASSQTIWEQFKVITLAHVSASSAGRSILRTVVSRICSSIFLFPSRRGNHHLATLAVFR